MQSCWIGISRKFGFGALVLLFASGACSAASTATISGVVRDAQGVAQMGTMVQVLTAGSINIASVFTDMHGRYRVAGLLPGSYQVRASSALFLAATRRNLRLANGMLATVNLTVSMLSDPVAWLPAERRKADEPGDDWTWTLRSAANRPILRMAGDAEPTDENSERRGSSLHAKIAMLDQSGTFAAGGLHEIAAVNRTAANGAQILLRTDLSAASSRVAVGYERTTPYAGAYRMVVSYSDNREISAASGASGMQAMRMEAARKMQLGENVEVEAGGTLYAIRTNGTAISSQPFVRVTVHPGDVWAVRYSFTGSHDVQESEQVNSVEASLPITLMSQGHVRSESGQHQEISLGRKLGRGAIQFAAFHDTINRAAVAGTGAVTASNLSGDVLIDTQSGTFRVLGPGYTANGIGVALSEPVTPSLWATFEYERGAGLAARGTDSEQLSQVAAHLRTEAADSFTAGLKGKVPRTGTKVRAAYRWQPQRLVTAVDGYDAPANQGYLGFYIRQTVAWAKRLPPGLEATVSVTNLLEQGYQPFLSADGQILFLAESPRTMQAGLSFTF